MSNAAAGAEVKPRTVPLLARLAGAKTPLKAQRAVWGYLLLLPWLLGLPLERSGPLLEGTHGNMW